MASAQPPGEEASPIGDGAGGPRPAPAAVEATEALTARLDSPVLQELRAMLELAATVRPVVAARAGLSASELIALEHLLAEPLGPVEIARRLHLTSAASSGIVDRLEQRGHVVREPHPGDRRRTHVVVTDSGRAEVLAHLVPMFAGLARADERLQDEHDREVVLAFLQDVSAAMRAIT